MDKNLLYIANVLFGMAAYGISGSPLYIFVAIHVNIFAMIMER